MMPRKISLLIYSVFFTLNLCAAPSTENDSSSILLGGGNESKYAELFNNNCVSCHSGGVPRAPHLTTFQVMSADYILSTLNGVMSAQAEGLTKKEKIGISEYITGGKVSSSLPEPNFCKSKNESIILVEENSYKEWGYDKENSRYTKSNLSSQNAKKLKLKWVFAYPSASRARSQPSISGNTIFVGGQNLYLYALDRETGCVRWRTKVDGEIRSAPAIYFSEKGNFLFAGDYEGNVYKINPYNGEKIWVKSLRYHPRVILTGSLRVDKDIIYVPLSSREWADGADPEYQCCSFRGGIMALSVANGNELWTSYSIPLPPKGTGKLNNMGIEILAPSGVPVWNSPTFDTAKNLIYYGTGEAYSSPAAETSDSVIAINKLNGDIEWVYQAESGDAWNMGCFVEADANCPEQDGPDWDFGASVVLANIDGKSVLFAGRKSGHVYGLDPDNEGKPLWIKRIGKGGFAGGVHWGMATDNKSVFAAIADTNFINKFPGPATPGIYSLDGISGKINWKFTPIDRCPENTKPACDIGISAALTATNDLVIGGGFDGWLYVLNKNTGELIWEFNTAIDFSAFTNVPSNGGSIESDGPVVIDNNIFINSGYQYGGRLGGNVLLNFEISE
ncbi:MAG: dehydrogenase [Rhodobiaceae bacterium]|nr:dehydrogenase [Rhodobiaceae bacterium]